MGLWLVSPVWASAAEAPKPLAPLNIEARYSVAWNGITIGRINFTAHEDGKKYSIIVDTKTHGIGSFFSSEKRVASASGLIKNGHYIPQHYESRPQGKNEDGRRTTMQYDATGKMTDRTRVPEDDVAWRAPVPIGMLGWVTDSVTAGLVLRHNLYDAIEKNIDEASVKTYDGARLAEMKFAAVKPNARVEVDGQYEEAVTTIASRQPIFGYTPKELKAFKKGDPVIHLYFSADEKFVPIRATVSTLFGELSANLIEIK